MRFQGVLICLIKVVNKFDCNCLLGAPMFSITLIFPDYIIHLANKQTFGRNMIANKNRIGLHCQVIQSRSGNIPNADTAIRILFTIGSFQLHMQSNVCHCTVIAHFDLEVGSIIFPVFRLYEECATFGYCRMEC